VSYRKGGYDFHNWFWPGKARTPPPFDSPKLETKFSFPKNLTTKIQTRSVAARRRESSFLLHFLFAQPSTRPRLGFWQFGWSLFLTKCLQGSSICDPNYAAINKPIGVLGIAYTLGRDNCIQCRLGNPIVGTDAVRFAAAPELPRPFVHGGFLFITKQFRYCSGNGCQTGNSTHFKGVS
jgi:hypothetical protein